MHGRFKNEQITRANKSIRLLSFRSDPVLFHAPFPVITSAARPHVNQSSITTRKTSPRS